jgi:hypothetical protein
MQHNNKHTDKKLQELENQSLPDLSGMDEHWQQMKTLLQPGMVAAKPKNGTIKKYFRWMIAAVFICGLFFLTYTLVNNNNTKQKKTAGNEKVIHQQPVKLSTDTAPSIKLLIRNDSIIIKRSVIDIKSTPLQLKTKKVTLKDTVLQLTPADIKIDPPVADAKASLSNFFKQLEKQPQQFMINNKRDTVINGAEGTELFIPGNCFGINEHVTIKLQEFYSYQDIITNRLSTTSNDKQLVTGGMLNIQAFADTGEITSIRNPILVNMPAKKYEADMQLFLPQPVPAIKTAINGIPGDTVQRDKPTSGFINWFANGQIQSSFNRVPLIKVLNLSDNFRIRYNDNDVAKYLISKNCPLSNQEVKAELEKKYGHKKVKVRRVRSHLVRIWFTKTWSVRPVIGDSILMPFYEALRTKLITKEDSAKYVQDLKSRRGKDSLNYMALASLESKYNFRITTLGWINCDRFYNDSRPKINYYVDLNDTAYNYQTMLVFDNIKSLMTGYISGNKVVFSNVPEGQPAKVISVGIQNGKTVAAMESVQLSKTPLTNLKFEDTSPAAFKEEMKGFDK